MQVGKDASPNQGSSDGGDEKWPHSGCIFIYLFIFCQSLPEDIIFSILTTFRDRSQNGVTLISIRETRRKRAWYLIENVGRQTKMEPSFAAVTHRGPPIFPPLPLYPQNYGLRALLLGKHFFIGAWCAPVCPSGVTTL